MSKKINLGKKCIGILTAIALMLTLAVTPMAAGSAGDLNGDNTVSAPDLATLTTVIITGSKDISYDVNGDGNIDILDLVRLKKILAYAKTEVTVAVDGKVPENGLTLAGGGVSAFVPTGVLLEEGVTELKLTVIPLTSSGVPAGEGETVTSYDVHISGISKDNTAPVIIDLGAVMPKFLNMGNYKIYHVENGENRLMTLVDSRENLTAHNQFTYEPETGKVTVAMATFSEVAMVANNENAWNGKFDYSWYKSNAIELTIANADQLAAFGAIVGGMNGKTQDSFAGKTVKLLADIDLGDDEANNVENKIFYPIGYYNSEGTYERTNTAITSGLRSFEGTFDGNGHSVSNFYHNTWEMKGDHDWYSPEEQYYRDGMGLFGRVYKGTVKNLTVKNFTSDGEIATTGVIAAYADGANFENIAIINCNPRVYNIGNGGIVGCVGWYAKDKDLKTTFKNITVDNTNKISALWGSYDVACGGIVGQYYPTSGQSSANYPQNAGIDFINCHVAAQMDVYNDVCGNYQYYAYRYAGMIIGSIRENITTEDGKVIPDMTGISATGCTVNYGTWNDYYYCEFEKNGHPSYSGENDYKFSRVPNSEIDASNGKENATCIGHNHTEAEDNQAIYLPFHQLFTGYSWGVSSIGLKEYSGIVTDLDITEGDQQESVEKFDSKIDGDLLYRVADGDTSYVGTLFKAKEDSSVAINGSSVHVTVEKVNESDEVLGTFTANAEDWTKGTVKFEGTGIVKVTIQDYYFCTPTVAYIRVVANLVKNGGLEYGKSGWGSTDNGIGTLSENYITTNTDDIYIGDYAATSSAYAYISTKFDAKANTDYVISFWYKGTSNLQMRLIDGLKMGPNNGWGTGTTLKVNGSDTTLITENANWTKATYYFNSDNITSNEITIRLRGVTNTAKIYIDNVEVFENTGLVKNGGVEYGKGYWGGSYFSMDNPANGVITPSEAHSGDYSIKPDNSGYVSTYFEGESNTDYVVSFWIKNNNTSYFRITNGITTYGSWNSMPEIMTTTNQSNNPIGAKSDWTKVTYRFNTGTLTDGNVGLVFGTGGTSQTLYIDDVEVVKNPYTDKLVLNGDLEAGSYGYDISANWRTQYYGFGDMDSYGFVSSTEKHSGNYSATANSNQYIFTQFNAEANTDYILTFWVKNSSQMTVRLTDGTMVHGNSWADNTTISGTENYYIGAKSEWTQQTIEFNSGNITSEVVGIIFCAGGGNMYIDDVEVVKK